jgi:hypothetical protein
MADPSNPVRQVLYEVIINLLSPELSVRQLAEQQVQALQVTDGKLAFRNGGKQTFPIAFRVTK